jgi:hypothetical protein
VCYISDIYIYVFIYALRFQTTGTTQQENITLVSKVCSAFFQNGSRQEERWVIKNIVRSGLKDSHSIMFTVTIGLSEQKERKDEFWTPLHKKCSADALRELEQWNADHPANNQTLVREKRTSEFNFIMSLID